jgi:SAM-dependent methyltransferase
MSENSSAQPAKVNRALFVATILTGSFLLFLVQPMLARMALPRLGGAPNVWNSAMLVYQALLLAGYFYAHRLSRQPLRRQASIHIGLLLAASITLPISLANLPPPASGSEAWWVPLLFLASIGPVFLLVSAQAPLMQRWFSAHPEAGEPWALYAASNLGSFAGLIAYPLFAEPNLSLRAQSVGWSLGYAILIVFIALSAWARWRASPAIAQEADRPVAEKVPARRILHWLALSAIPSGLMLSTTTHLTTDLFAMPLLWVIPLGLYLLSFVAAFSDRRAVADVIAIFAPLTMLMAGGLAMTSQYAATLTPVFQSVVLLFVVSVTLHARMYDLRPPAAQLTLFYLIMSAGGALGGLFTALVAPQVFDWVWEHPLLVFAAAVLMPLPRLLDWRRLSGLDPTLARAAAVVIMGVAIFLAVDLWGLDPTLDTGWTRPLLILGTVMAGTLLIPWRWAWLTVLLLLMLAQGGSDTIRTSLAHARSRSYFGIYTVRQYEMGGQMVRTLAHGTTLHGQQSLEPAHSREPMSYYGKGSGAAIALGQAQALYGANARIGIVGLGTGTLACFHQPGESWRFFEIDPAVLAYSRNGTFTFVKQCAPDAKVVLGDARLDLARMPASSLDMLAVDAFSSDAIPLHLLTDEAFGVYLDALGPRGLLLVHISNRYIELEPVLAAVARKRGLAVLKRDDNPSDRTFLTPSTWVALSRDPAVLAALGKARPDAPWAPPMPPAPRVWTDDHASILPYIRWQYLLKKPS